MPLRSVSVWACSIIGAWYSCPRHHNVDLSLTSRTIVSPLVTSVSGACSSRHPSRAAAEVAFARALATHLVRLVE